MEAKENPKKDRLIARKSRRTKSPRVKKERTNPTRLINIPFLPSLFTLLSLFVGFQALLMIIKGEFMRAIYFIAICVVLDGFDGTIARLTKTESNFGFQLDSLNDGVVFGLVTAMLIYFWGFQQYYTKLGALFGFAFVCAGLIRLARFNVYKEANLFPANVFVGLPIPLGALAVCSWVLMFKGKPPTDPRWVLIFALVCLLVSLLMISNIKYITVKNVQLKNNLRILLVLAFVVGLGILYPSYTIPFFSFLYVLSPIVIALHRFFGKGGKKKSGTPGDSSPMPDVKGS